MTTAVTDKHLERLICEKSFRHFLRHVRIVEPPLPGIPGSGGAIPFEPWPHLMDLADALVQHRLVVVLKARQNGITWLVAAYLAWLGIHRPGSDWLLLSRTEPDAFDFLSRVVDVIRLLPVHLSLPFAKPPSAGTLTLANGSRFTAMASTEDAGRGHTYSGVAQDEADYHPYLSQNFAAAKPTIDAGGQMIQVSTVNKRRLDTLFKGLYRGAPANGWRKFFFGWRARPGRDQDWYEHTKANVPAASGMTPELYMEENYPATEIEALSPSRALAFFNPDALARLEPSILEPEMKLGGLVRIWQPKMVAVHYVGFGDVCWGHHSAFSCFVLAACDYKHAVQVAEIYGRPEHDEYAQAIADLTREYNSAYFGIEANGETTERSGLNVVNKLIDLGLGARMYHHGENWLRDQRHRGWLTTGINRSKMLGELEEAIRGRAVIPRCVDALSEMSSFIRTEGGRAEAAGGAFSDHVMAWAGLWQMVGEARYNEEELEPAYVGRRF